MSSAVNELSGLLRGGEAPENAHQAAAAAAAAGGGGGGAAGAAAAAAAAAKAAGVDISKLSQLSDFADKELQKDKPRVDAHFSQESLIDAPANPLAFQQASQPDIPPPVLPESQNMSQLPPGSGAPGVGLSAEEQQKQMAAAAAAAASVFSHEQMMAAMMAPSMMGMGMGAMDWGQHLVAAPGMEGAEPGEQPGPRSKSGKPTRRGPMDEMRQLVRILVKLIPQSIGHIGANEEAGGGNRISEDQIKNYLEKTLGEAPRPPWGVPSGWFSYVSELFTWALGRTVDEESTKLCAKREPGRSWEALEGELAAIGVHPHCWPLPLTLVAVREAEKNPVPQPIPTLPTVKRGADGEPTARGGRSRSSVGGGGADLDRMGEYELWKHLNDVLAHCSNKQGTAPPELHQSLGNLRGQAKAQMDVLAGGVGGLNMLQYVPVMMDGNPSMMAFLGGMQGMPMGLPPMGPDGQVLPPDAAAAAMAAAAAAGGAEAVAGGGGGGEERAAKRPRREGQEGGPTSSTEEEGHERRADKSKAPMSSSEARGTLFGALGGAEAGKDGGKQGAQQQLMQQAQLGQLGQLPLLYATQPGASSAPFVMPPGFPGVLPPGVADGSAPAEGTPAPSQPGAQA